MRAVLLSAALLLSLAASRSAWAEHPPEFVASWHCISAPRCIAADGQGNIYAAEFDNAVRKYSNTGALVGGWMMPVASTSEYDQARDVAVDRTGGYVYVSDGDYDRVGKFDSEGNLLFFFGSRGSGDGQFQNPRQAAVDASGSVYVTDLGNSRIQKFDSSGQFLLKWGSLGSGPGQFRNPSGIAVDSHNDVYVADYGNNRIQKFDENGTFILEWGSAGTSFRQFMGPLNLAVDAQDNLYVTEYSIFRVQKFASDGHFLYTFTCGDGQYPGVAVDPSGEIYLSDYGHGMGGRIVRFTPCTGPCLGPAPGPDDPRLLIHVVPSSTSNPCADVNDCEAVRTQAGLSGPSGPFYYACLLVFRGNLPSIAGFQCGITYQDERPENVNDHLGIDILGWNLCATWEFVTPDPNKWPRPGGGNLITWDPTTRCQTGSLALAGYFYVAAYSPDRLRIIPRPADGVAKVADCDAVETILSPDGLGYASFSADALDPGCNPCLDVSCTSKVIPVVPTTWSRIKTQGW